MLNAQNLEYIAANLIKSGVILTVGFIIQVIAGALLKAVAKKALDEEDDHSSKFEQKAKTLLKLINNIANIFVFAIVVLMLLSLWGIDITPILTGAGILGLAVGFGTQTLVRDLVTGFFILFENQYNVGDYIKTAGIEGTVTEIRLRTTVLKGDNNVVHIIPNSTITSVTRVNKDK